MPPKKCPSDKVLNPYTGICVKKDGAIGKQILAGTYKPKSPSTQTFKAPKQPIKFKPKYPNIAKWIEENLIYGDTKAFFMDSIDKQAVKDAIIKVSEIVAPELNKILSQQHDSMNIYSEVHNLILLASPWPGFIKKPHTIDHLEDYSFEGDIIGAESLFKAYLKDYPQDHRTVLDLMKIYYDDPNYGDDNEE